jgi:hypothetical protein
LKRKRNILQVAFLKSDLSSYRIVLVVQSKIKQEEKNQKGNKRKRKRKRKERKEKKRGGKEGVIVVVLVPFFLLYVTSFMSRLASLA